MEFVLIIIESQRRRVRFKANILLLYQARTTARGEQEWMRAWIQRNYRQSSVHSNAELSFEIPTRARTNNNICDSRFATTHRMNRLDIHSLSALACECSHITVCIGPHFVDFLLIQLHRGGTAPNRFCGIISLYCCYDVVQLCIHLSARTSPNSTTRNFVCAQIINRFRNRFIIHEWWRCLPPYGGGKRAGKKNLNQIANDINYEWVLELI